MNTMIIAMLLAGFSGAALAAEPPKAVSNDGLVCTQVYDPNQVTIIHLERGREITVILAPTERIQWISDSDSAHLMTSVLDNKNVFTLKPIGPLAPQPLTVTTARDDGSLRTYTAQIDARLPDDTPASGLLSNAALTNKPTNDSSKSADDPLKPCYVIRYTYPADEKAAAAAKWRAEHAQQAEQWRAAHDAALLKQNTLAHQNVRYVAIGDRNLAPNRIFDDGNSTFMEFWGNRSIPAPFGIDRAGKDKLLTGFSSEEGVCPGGTAPSATCLKLFQVQTKFRLRDQEDLGGDAHSLLIFNRAFDPVGDRPGTGTTNPTVQREVGK